MLRMGQGAAAPRRQSLPLVAPYRGDPPHEGALPAIERNNRASPKQWRNKANPRAERRKKTLVARLSTYAGGRRGSEREAKRSSERRRGRSPLTHAKHPRRACSRGQGGACATLAA